MGAGVVRFFVWLWDRLTFRRERAEIARLEAELASLEAKQERLKGAAWNNKGKS